MNALLMAEVRQAAPETKQAVKPTEAPKATNAEVLKRKPTFASEEEHVMAVIGRSHKEAIQEGKNAKATPLERALGSYGLLSQLKPGDTFNPPITIEHAGATFIISEVFANQGDGRSVLRNPRGGVVDLFDILGGTQDKIRQALPPPSADEPPGIKFARAFLESKKPGGPPVDKALMKEAAQKAGLLVSDDIAEMAKTLGVINADEHQHILSGTQPDAKATPLSPKAEALRQVLNGATVLSAEQVKQAFDAAGIPYSSKTFIDYMKGKVDRQVQIPNAIKVAIQKEDAPEATRLEQEAEAIQNELRAVGKVDKKLAEYRVGGSWDAVDTYYNAVESGNTPPDTAQIPTILEAYREGNGQAVLDAIGDPDKIAAIDRKRTLKAAGKRTLQITGGFAGVAAAFAIFSIRKKDRDQQ